MNKVVAATLLLNASSLCFADWKFETHTSNGAETPPEVEITYVRGQRVRSEVPNTGFVVIYQCDQNCILRINSKAKYYSATPLSGPRQMATGSPEAQGRCCGSIHVRQQLTETNEHQQIFGLDAQRILTQIQLRADPGTCALDAGLQRELDGWYTDQLNFPDCVNLEHMGFAPGYPSGDPRLTEGKGVDAKLFGLKLTARDLRQGLPAIVITSEVVNLSSDPLPDDLFDAPAGFTERPSEPVSIPPSNCAGTTINASAPPGGTTPYRPGPGIVMPKPIYHPEPSYTDAARKAKVSGTVVLSLTVTSDGRVDALRVERSVRPDLDEQALTTVSTWRFEPGTKDGVPVPVRLSVEVSFKLL